MHRVWIRADDAYFVDKIHRLLFKIVKTWFESILHKQHHFWTWLKSQKSWVESLTRVTLSLLQLAEMNGFSFFKSKSNPTISFQTPNPNPIYLLTVPNPNPVQFQNSISCVLTLAESPQHSICLMRQNRHFQ